MTENYQDRSCVSVAGPHRSTQKRPPTLVSVLQSLAAAEIANIQHPRDFQGLSIFDFFNSIRQ
jgi:hypothetical protein